MRLSDLYRKPVHDSQGRRLGIVHEVSVKDGVVQALHFGPGSLLERFTGKSAGRRVPWDKVRSVTADRITIDR